MLLAMGNSQADRREKNQSRGEANRLLAFQVREMLKVYVVKID
jgi:hypothetical protein